MSLVHKLRWWWAGDRVVKVAITNSTVMGQSAVLCLASVLGIVGVLQLTGAHGSHVVSQWGGFQLDTAWSICLIAAFVLVWIAYYRRHRYDSGYWEIGGCALIIISLMLYVVALFNVGEPLNAGLAIGLCFAASINVAGRSLLLVRRLRELRRGIL